MLIARSLLLIFLAFTSCTFQRLSVHTDYIGRETLASFQIGTPDPLSLNPPTGQRLIVKWHLPRAYLELEDLHLAIAIRFKDRSKQSINLSIRHTTGTYIYPVLCETYTQTRGILTYQVQVMAGDQTLEEWVHPLWVTLIELNSEDSPPAEEPVLN